MVLRVTQRPISGYLKVSIESSCNDVDSDKLIKVRQLCSQAVNARHHIEHAKYISDPADLSAVHCMLHALLHAGFFFFNRLKRSLSAKQSEMWQCKR